jgi:16S rRNA (guanine966-N2)-methyltransferase
MRIVGGRHRGRVLAGPGPESRETHLRPTADRVRESLFNILAHSDYRTPPPPAGCRVLDLFAGTGALGLEALSRGAQDATFVDTGPRALEILRRNVAALGAGPATRVIERDATRLGQNRDLPYDLVFLDPPYGKGLGERALVAALSGGWLAPDALVLWEEARAAVPPPGLTLCDTRRYGDTMIAILRASPT